MQQLTSPDGKARVKAQMSQADELMWLNFETKIRNVVRGLLEPVVDMS